MMIFWSDIFPRCADERIACEVHQRLHVLSRFQDDVEVSDIPYNRILAIWCIGTRSNPRSEYRSVHPFHDRRSNSPGGAGDEYSHLLLPIQTPVTRQPVGRVAILVTYHK